MTGAQALTRADASSHWQPQQAQAPASQVLPPKLPPGLRQARVFPATPGQGSQDERRGDHPPVADNECWPGGRSAGRYG